MIDDDWIHADAIKAYTDAYLSVDTVTEKMSAVVAAVGSRQLGRISTTKLSMSRLPLLSCSLGQ